MRFSANILPTSPDRWVLSSGSMVDNFISLNAGGNAYIILTPNDTPFIPSAFQVRIRQDHAITWKDPIGVATFLINYEDGSQTRSIVPLNPDFMENAEYVTINVAFVQSKTFTSMYFTIENNTADIMNITLFELLPSIDLDEGLQSAIEQLQTQLLYTYNETAVNIPEATETIVIRAVIDIGRQSDLAIRSHFTGTCSDSLLSATLYIDGSPVTGFPLRQNFNPGYFYYAIPSLIPEVPAGEHNILITLISSNGAVNIDIEKAMLSIEGRGVGTSGAGPNPSVEEFDSIPFVDFDSKFLLDESYNISLEDI